MTGFPGFARDQYLILTEFRQEFGPLLWQVMQTVSSMSASACHIGGPNSDNPGQILLAYGNSILHLFFLLEVTTLIKCEYLSQISILNSRASGPSFYYQVRLWLFLSSKYNCSTCMTFCYTSVLCHFLKLSNVHKACRKILCGNASNSTQILRLKSVWRPFLGPIGGWESLAPGYFRSPLSAH